MPTLWFGTGELLTNSRIIGYDVVTMSKSEVQYRIEGAMSSWLDRHAKSR